MQKVTHIPVLLDECISGLQIKEGDVIVDGTFGGGGHSKAILERYGNIELICVDLDEKAMERFQNGIAPKFKNAAFAHANFKDVEKILNGRSHVNKVLLDLGTSTFQLLDDTRGFSFQSNTPLHMAFSETGSHTGISAWDIANSWDESSIADIIFAYGEDRSSRKIARAIVEARANGPIETSTDLANAIQAAFKSRGRIHPATKTFQAIRITVNDELQVLKDALEGWWSVLDHGGRIAVITFHSLEDRIVKQWMKSKTNERVITKKPIIAKREELLNNTRSRSAKLRIIEKA